MPWVDYKVDRAALGDRHNQIKYKLSNENISQCVYYVRQRSPFPGRFRAAKRNAVLVRLNAGNHTSWERIVITSNQIAQAFDRPIINWWE